MKTFYYWVVEILALIGSVITFVGTLVNFWSKASDMLCAGSVDIMRTDSRTLAN